MSAVSTSATDTCNSSTCTLYSQHTVPLLLRKCKNYIIIEQLYSPFISVLGQYRSTWCNKIMDWPIIFLPTNIHVPLLHVEVLILDISRPINSPSNTFGYFRYCTRFCQGQGRKYKKSLPLEWPILTTGSYVSALSKSVSPLNPNMLE